MIGRHRTIKIIVKQKVRLIYDVSVVSPFLLFFANPLLPGATKEQSWVEELKIFIYVMTFESVSQTCFPS